MSLAPSSPRLPSPPPPAEIQLGPNSPSGGAAATLETTAMEQSLLDANSKRRIHPGTRAEDMAAGPPLMPLNELESAFQLQEHLAALHFYHTSFGTQALTRATALQLAQPPPGIDRTIWLYELCRFLISQCNSLIVGFLFDTPPCSASTCPEMRASEWQFLCAVHEQPKSCCAIDYCCHTLDWAANVVTDQKLFPSRFAILNDTQSKNVGLKNLVNVFRRLHRIFAHAWFQHRSVFWSVEGQAGLYVFFKTVCDLYDLLPAENYKLPPEAEGLEAPPVEPENEKPPPQILKAPSQQRNSVGEEENLHPVGRTNTRRHIRSSPSTGSAVTTVLEAEEDENDAVTRRLREMHLAAPLSLDEEPEVADVPVIVEKSIMDESSPQDGPPPDLSDDAGDVSDADQTVVEVEPEDLPEQDAAPDTENVVTSAEVHAPVDESTTSAEPVGVPLSKDDAPGANDGPADTPEPLNTSPTDSSAPDALAVDAESTTTDGEKAATAPAEEPQDGGK